MATVDSNTIVYQPTAEDIFLFKKQINIDDTLANQLLIKHAGNMVDAILDASNFDQSSIKEMNSKTYDVYDTSQSVNQTLNSFRNILDAKDSVFVKNVSKEIDTTGSRIYEYVAFDATTTVFKRKQFRGTQREFMDDIVLELLEHPEDETTKVTLKYLGGDANRILSTKWGFYKAAIIYLETTNPEEPNKLATTLLQKAGHISHQDTFNKPCIVVNNWL